MLLRSSSTPVLGSLLSSTSSSHHISDSPDNATHHHHHPISSPLGFRRARSDDNLHSLLLPDSSHYHLHHKPSILETAPTLSIYKSNLLDEVEDLPEEEEEGEEGEDFVFLGSIPQRETPLFLARGLGIDRLASGLLTMGDGSAGGGGKYGDLTTGGDGGEHSDVDNYYKRMMEEDPSAVLLGNYAQFLYQVKGDAQRAEEYYSRAILTDPGDGEILSQYAKLIWELHHDEERASSYFERAVQVSPQNSHVIASYAGFLWEIDDGDDGKANGGINQPQDYFGLPLHRGAVTSAAT